MFVINLLQDKNPKNPYISNSLIEKIEESLKMGKKTILYLNKRGEYSSLVCTDCQKIYSCPQCDSGLTVHFQPEKLLCHFCGFNREKPLKCDECHGSNLLKVGVGTQQIENFITGYFKNHTTFRLDFDAIKNVTQKKQTLKNIENADIVIGTKMITTGFDFKNIGLIGIILAEQELMIPSFDNQERVYINFKQLIGRTREKDTQIVLQTFVPDSDFVQMLVSKNYKDFLLESLEERRKFHLPPFTQIAILEYRNLSKSNSLEYMKSLKKNLDLLNTEKNYEIILSGNMRKRYNQFYTSIQIKGENVGEFLIGIKSEILRNSHLTLQFF